MKLDEIRQDLKDIRYYYSRKSMFDSTKEEIGSNYIVDKANRYNKLMKNASPLLFDLYVCLYTKNYTQEQLANELCYTQEYVQMLNKKLLVFLQENLSKQGGMI